MVNDTCVCKDLYFYDSISDLCVESCPNGYFNDKTTKLCETCYKNCEKC